MKTRFKKKKSKKSICPKLCLNFWFENDWYFCCITQSGWLWKRLNRNKVPSNHFLISVWKSNCPNVHCGTVDWLSTNFPIRGSIKLVITNTEYTCMESYPISYYCKQLIKILISCLLKLNGCFFLRYAFRRECPEKFSKQTLLQV